MKIRASSVSILSCVLVAALGALQIGCGELTIRTWINIIEEESGGGVQFLPQWPGGPMGPYLQIEKLQGGFLTELAVDTRDLPGPLSGVAVVPDLRIAGQVENIVGELCAWTDPLLETSGTIVLDLLAGTGSASLDLNLQSTTWLQENSGIGAIPVNQTLELDLAEGLGMESFLAALDTGSLAGTIAAESTVEQLVNFGLGIKAIFTLNLSVVNEDLPPLIDQNEREFCAPFFAQQGAGTFYFVNSMSSYLRADDGDTPLVPVPIPLAELGAEAGDTLRITRVGTYASDESRLRDGTQTDITGVFSSSDVILADDERYRVEGAIDAGDDVHTDGYLECIFLFCYIVDTDIPEDFDVDPQVDVVVPAGAEYLIVAPYDTEDQEWESNGGFGFGVNIEVNP